MCRRALPESAHGARSARLPLVHGAAVVYLIFNEGYAATAGFLLRLDLCAEGIRLARALTTNPVEQAFLDAQRDAWKRYFDAYAAAFEPVIGPQEGPPTDHKGEI